MKKTIGTSLALYVSLTLVLLPLTLSAESDQTNPSPSPQSNTAQKNIPQTVSTGAKRNYFTITGIPGPTAYPTPTGNANTCTLQVISDYWPTEFDGTQLKVNSQILSEIPTNLTTGIPLSTTSSTGPTPTPLPSFTPTTAGSVTYLNQVSGLIFTGSYANTGNWQMNPVNGRNEGGNFIPVGQCALSEYMFMPNVLMGGGNGDPSWPQPCPAPNTPAGNAFSNLCTGGSGWSYCAWSTGNNGNDQLSGWGYSGNDGYSSTFHLVLTCKGTNLTGAQWSINNNDGTLNTCMLPQPGSSTNNCTTQSTGTNGAITTSAYTSTSPNFTCTASGTFNRWQYTDNYSATVKWNDGTTLTLNTIVDSVCAQSMQQNGFIPTQYDIYDYASYNPAENDCNNKKNPNSNTQNWKCFDTTSAALIPFQLNPDGDGDQMSLCSWCGEYTGNPPNCLAPDGVTWVPCSPYNCWAGGGGNSDIRSTQDGGGCFVEGTRIEVGGGRSIPVELVARREYIWNPMLKKYSGIKKIVKGPEYHPLYEIGYSKHTLKVTELHPMLTEKGLIPAAQIKRGMRLLGGDGRWHAVTHLKTIPVDAKKPPIVYNIELKGADESNRHLLMANGIVTGDLSLQRKMKLEPTEKAAAPVP